MKKNSKTQVFVINNKKYNVRMTNVHYYDEMSDETNAFTGVLTISDGTNTYEIGCRNEGRGGETEIKRWGANKEICDIIISYLKTIPNTPFIEYAKQIGMNITEESPFYYMDLETLVDNLVEECL